MASRLSGGGMRSAVCAAFLAGSALVALGGCRSPELGRVVAIPPPRAVAPAAGCPAGGSATRPWPASAEPVGIPSRFRGAVLRRRVRYFPEKLVALTFDDGPDPVVTPRVLKALSEWRAHATFFVNGRLGRLHPDLLRAIAEGGHAIGNHTFSHPARCSSRQARRELDGTEDVVLAATGRKPALFRPPYGSTKSACARLAAREGYTTVLWTISSADSRPIEPAVIARNVTHTPNPGDIVIFHDGFGHAATADALPEVLKGLAEEGFTCVTIPELLHAWDRWEAQVPQPTLAKRNTRPATRTSQHARRPTASPAPSASGRARRCHG